MESKKMALMNLFSEPTVEKQTGNRPLDMGGGEDGEGEMYRERNMEIYNTIYKIDSQWEFSVGCRELKQGLCDRLKSGMRREMRGRFGREEGA